MAKTNEKRYFKNIGDDGLRFSLNKPYSDRISIGSLIHNIASVATILKNQYGVKNLKIIDIGCGSGWTSNQFALVGHDVTGVDISPDAIIAAKETFRIKNLNYVETDYDKIKKDYKSIFDVAIFIDSLHHSDSVEETLKSARATLKEGGICIVCEPGLGHSVSPDAIEAVAKYGVTEADLPPSKIIKSAKKAGYKRYKIYPSPALMHRSLYGEYSEGSKKIVKYDIFRLLSIVSFFLLKRRKEGLVVLYN